MTTAQTAKGRRRKAPLYHAAKISDHRFRKVLWQFVRDETATTAARDAGLSVNTVVGIFRKLRVYFYEVRLFSDIYDGADPTTHHDNEPVFEHALLGFHFGRIGAHRGLKSLAGEPDYHFAESHWRYHFQVLIDQRPSGQVHAMMLAHLLEIIGLCGPVGAEPHNHRAGLLAVLRQMDQRIQWLERNAAGFGTPALRAGLKAVRLL